jgi:23S rRNA maturation mini-RNase III
VETISLDPFPEVAMLSNGPTQRKKTWKELASAASKETDPEKIATIVEEIFAALEEREQTHQTRAENP